MRDIVAAHWPALAAAAFVIFWTGATIGGFFVAIFVARRTERAREVPSSPGGYRIAASEDLIRRIVPRRRRPRQTSARRLIGQRRVR